MREDYSNKRKTNGLDLGTVVYGKVPPQAKDLEEAVLGALMLERSFLQIEEILQPHVFYVEAHQRIFTAMRSLSAKMQPIDIMTVTEELRRTGELDLVGGPYYITKLTNSVVSSANIEAHARIIIQKWIQREMITMSLRILEESYDDGADALDVLGNAEAKLSAVSQLISTGSTMNYNEAVAERTAFIMNNDGSRPPGLQTGFPSLDRLLMYFAVQLYIIAARPGVGKTALLLQLIRNISGGTKFHRGVPVGFLELETTEEAFIDRHLANISGLDSFKLKAGGLDESEKNRLQEAAGMIMQTEIYASFLSVMDMRMIRQKARVWVKKHGIKILFIDYLQIITATEQEEKMNRERQVSKLATGLAGLAKELKIPIVALAQLSREVLKRADKRPTLGDLRESGTIEAASKCIMFLHKPERSDDDMIGNDLPEGAMEIIVAKHNDGPTGTAILIQVPHLSKYIDPGAGFQTGIAGSMPQWKPVGEVPEF